MKNRLNILVFFVAISLGSIVNGQNANATISIENAHVTGDVFTWEVHLTPIDDWSSTGNTGLGDCSWYFTFNSDALVNPTIVYEGEAVAPSQNYFSTAGITGTGDASRIYIDTDFTLDLSGGMFGVQLEWGTDYHLYTVEMTITDIEQLSNLTWDQINTGVFTAFDIPIIETYSGDGDISLQDVTGPTIEQVYAFSQDGSYRADESVMIVVQFSEPVSVTGTPILEMETGSIDQPASYVSGSGSYTLQFLYNIQSGDNSLDLGYTSINALGLDSGTIKDGANNDAVVILPEPGTENSLSWNSEIIIDTEFPTLISGTVNEANTFVDLGLSEDVYSAQDDGGGLDVSDFTLSYSQNDGHATGANLINVTSISGDSLSGGEDSIRVWISVTGLPDGEETISVSPADGNSIYDLAGNAMPVSSAVTINLAIQFIPPIIFTSTDSLNYLENTGYMAVDETLTVTDENNSHLDSAWVTIVESYHPTEDTLICVGTDDIAIHYDDLSGILSLTGNAPVEEYQTLLRSVMYMNDSENPSVDLRTVQFVANDGGGNSEPVNRSVVVVPVNDPPVLAFADTTVNYIENADPVIIVSEMSISDFDDVNIDSAWISFVGGYKSIEDTLIISNSGEAQVSFDDNIGVLTIQGTSTLAEYIVILSSVGYQNSSDNPDTDTRAIEFSVNDGDTSSVAVTRQVSITSVNDAPVLTSIGVQVTNEDTAKVIHLSAMDVEDDILSFAVTCEDPNIFLSLDSTILTMGTAPNWNGTADITVTVTDYDLTDSETFIFVVNSVNDIPNALATTGNGPVGGTISIPMEATDIDHTNPDEFTFIVVSPPAHISGEVSIGEVSYASGTFSALATYQHDGMGSFTDTLTYKANDGEDDSDVSIAIRTVSPSDYEYSATMTALLQMDYTSLDDGNMIAAFSNNECIGIAEPIYQLGQWMYFLTFYSNTSMDTVEFYAWRSEDDLVYPIEETVVFQPSINFGSPLEPFLLNIVIDYDYPPVITDIPDQITEIGTPFTPLDLDDYTTLLDDDTISWSVSGESNLTITIDGENIVTATPNPEWIGSEVITFTATDQTNSALFSDKDVLFTILPMDYPPVLSGVPGQEVGYYQPFVSYDLNDYLTEEDGDSLVWGYYVEAPTQPDTLPDWIVTPQDYIMSMSITGSVKSQGRTAEGDSHILAAFSGDECRGSVVPTYFQGTWIYFLSIYANSAGEDISLRFYDANNQQNLPVSEVFEFSSGLSLGSPQSPYELNAGHFLADINENGQVTVDKVEELWAGSEIINFIVTDVGTLNDYSDTSFAEFIVYQDYAPVVSGIEDQIVEQTIDFFTFDLDDYLTELDGHSVEWSVSGNVNLDVSIDGENVVTISPFNPDWTGSEEITFIVTDQTASGFYTSDDALFTILPYDNPPVLSNIPGQSVGYYQPFESFYLSDYLIELDGDNLIWDYVIEAPVETDPYPIWNVNPSDYTMSMTLTAALKSQGRWAEGNSHTLAAFSGDECRGTATGTDFAGTWVYFLTVYSDSTGEEISFRFFDDDYEQNLPASEMVQFSSGASIGTPQSPYELNAGHFLVDIDENSQVNIEQVEALWAGNETISYIIKEIGSLHEYSDTASALYTVYQDYAPVVSEIPNQTIEQTTDFSTFDLDDYLTELDGHEIAWSYDGNINLGVSIDINNIVSISTLNSDWTGTEEITFTVTDQTPSGFFTNEDVTFTILPYDHPPSISDFPDQVITLGEQFDPIYLADNLIEQDGDTIAWSFNFIPPEEADPLPEWSVNPSDYEMSMTATVLVVSRDEPALGSNHILGAFYQNECRGIVTEPVEFYGIWLYFMTIYSNNNGEEISFRFYDGEFGSDFPVLETIEFMANTSIGEPGNPLTIQAGDFIIDFSSQVYGYIQQVEQNLTGSTDILITANDVGSIHEYSDTAQVSITVNNDWPVIDDIEDIVFYEDSYLVVDLSEYISDYGTPDWGITWSVSGNEHVSVEFENGIATFTSNENWNGTEIVGFTALDDDETNPLSTTTPVTIFVEPVNDVPIANAGNNQELTVVHDQDPLTNTIEIILSGVGTDIDGDSLWYSWTFADDTVATTSEYTMDLIAGDYTFFLTVSDGELTASDSVNIVIHPEENTVPVADAIVDTTDEDTELSIVLTAEDADGDELVYAILDSTEMGIITGDIPRLTFTPNDNVNGVESFTFIVADGYGVSDTAIFTIVIAPVNDVPVFAELSNQSLEDVGDTLTFGVSATDIDGDNLILNMESDSLPPEVVFADNGDGTGLVSWIPVPADTGNYVVTFIANDGTATGETNIIISIGDINRPPELATIGNKEIAETDTLTIEISAFDSDGDSLFFQVDSLPEGGLFVDNQDSTATLTWIPGYDDAGEYEMTVTVTDIFYLSDAETFSVTVLNVNRPPVADAAVINTDEDSAIELVLTGTDLDEDSLSFSVITGSLHGIYLEEWYNPNENFNGHDSLTFRVSDGELADTATVIINVISINDAPIANAGDDQEITIIHDGDPLTNTVPVTVVGTGTDIDGDDLVMSWRIGGGMEEYFSAEYTTDLPAGEYTFILTVTDGEGSVLDSVDVIVNPEPNTLPVAYTQGVTTPEDTEISITLNGSDTNGDTLIFEVVSDPVNGVLTEDLPAVIYHPNLNTNGVDTFTFHISDGYGFSDTADVVITIEAINDAPTADDQNVITNEDTPVTFELLVMDIDYDLLTFTLLDSTVYGVLTGTLPELTYTPFANYIGTDSLRFAVSDGSLSDTAQVNILVQEINDPPLIAAIDSQMINEDESLAVELSAMDIDGDALTFTASSSNTNVVATVDDTTLTLSPVLNWNGAADITVIVTDDGTGALSDTTTFILTVIAVNDAPVISTPLPDVTIDEDDFGAVIVPSLEAYFVDIDEGDILLFTGDALDEGLDSISLGSVNLNSLASVSNYNGKSVYSIKRSVLNTMKQSSAKGLKQNMSAKSDIIGTSLVSSFQSGTTGNGGRSRLDSTALVVYPTENFVGNIRIALFATDTSVSSVSDTLLLTIENINDPPLIAAIDSQMINEDESLAVELTAVDIDGDAFTFTASSSNTNVVATVDDTTLTLTPALNWNGAADITVIVTDDGTGTLSDTTTFILTVIAVNDAPVLAAIDDQITTEDTPATVSLSATDTEGSALTYTVTSAETNVTASVSDTTLTLTPSSDWNGVADITVIVTDDGAGTLSDTTTFILTVIAVNDAPVAYALSDTTDEDTPVSFELLGSDIDGDSLTFSVIDSTTNGTLTGILPVLTYTPNQNYLGLDSFTFAVNDGEYLDTAAVSLTIQGINDAPVANAGEDQVVIGGMTVTLDGSSSSDIEGSELTYSWSSDEGLQLTTDGFMASFIAPEEEGTYLFTLTVNDGEMDSEPDMATVTVMPATTLDSLPDYTDNPPEEGDNIGVEYTFPGFFEADTVTLFYMEGGHDSFTGTPMQEGGHSSVFNTVIPSNINTYNGVAFYIEAMDINTNTLITDTVSIPVQIPEGAISSRIEDSPYKEGIQKEVWRMVSVPSDLDDDAVDNIYNAVLGSSGEYDWRLYEWDGAEWTDASVFRQGGGYWFNQWVTDTVSFDLGSGLSSDLTGTAIELLPGWNLISSPYLFPVRVHIDSSTFTGLYSYGDYEGEGWNPDLTNELKPWGAYAIFNRTGENQIFIIDPLNQPEVPLAKLAESTEGWELTLNLTGEGFSDLGTSLGRHPTATEDCDASDHPKPVSPGDYISLAIQQPEWKKGLRLLSSDIRSSEENNGSWDLELNTKGNHGKLNVTTDLTGQFPSEYEMVIIDCINGETIDLKQNTSFTIERYSEKYTRKYTVIAGESNYVQSKVEEIQSLIPKEFSLSQNYPNPFNPTTTIEYSIAEPGNVQIIIYDMLGREVKTLVNAFHDVGYNQVQWNGTNTNDISVASGMYLCRLSSPGVSIIRKMVLIK